MTDRVQVAVIGAGPAGLAAAACAAEHGLETILLDEQPSVGGQIYRAITETPVRDEKILGASYWQGKTLVERFRRSGAIHAATATVWNISRQLEISASLGGQTWQIIADHIILATGALERPFPIPGWTLPGVMTAGAAQILLKQSGLVADGRVVLAGSGPLLWLLAAQLLRAGGAINAILETSSRGALRRAWPHAAAFALSSYAGMGVSLLTEVRRQVRVIGRVTALRADGSDRLSSVTFRQDDGTEQTLPADLLLLHQGVAPNVNLANAIGCRHVWDPVQLSFRPVVDAWGISSIGGISIAGDSAGIEGADAAAPSGELAALEAAHRLGAITTMGRDQAAAAPRAARAQACRGRRFLDLLYQPAQAFRIPTGDTMVCRCEEVTAAQVEATLKLGVMGPNQMKIFLRCGMGPCQGRLCGLTVTEMIARAQGVSPDAVGYYRLRPPVKPITLGELADVAKTPADIGAVVR
jgi:NADPH-dependent 2,4-dienoyl-CoA reductase/sulfur reductase-like enzyme